MQYVRMQWETDTRYYLLEVSKDMLGHWVMTRLWRSKHAKSGQSRITSSAMLEDVETLIREVSKRREQRGYRIIEEMHQ